MSMYIMYMPASSPPAKLGGVGREHWGASRQNTGAVMRREPGWVSGDDTSFPTVPQLTPSSSSQE